MERRPLSIHADRLAIREQKAPGQFVSACETRSVRLCRRTNAVSESARARARDRPLYLNYGGGSASKRDSRSSVATKIARERRREILARGSASEFENAGEEHRGNGRAINRDHDPRSRWISDLPGRLTSRRCTRPVITGQRSARASEGSEREGGTEEAKETIAPRGPGGSWERGGTDDDVGPAARKR